MKYDKLIAIKCVLNASEYIWLRWEARSVLIVIESVKLYCVRNNSDSFLKCSVVFGTMRIMMGRAIVYDKLTAEKCVEDASEYI